MDNTAQTLKVSVFDKDPFKSDYNSGSEIILQNLCKPDVVDAWFNLEFKKNVVGKIHLKAKWIPPTN